MPPKTLRRVSIRLTEEDIERIERIQREGMYPKGLRTEPLSVSEAIRAALCVAMPNIDEPAPTVTKADKLSVTGAPVGGSNMTLNRGDRT